MTQGEAQKAGVGDHYKRLFRFGDAKENLTPPPPGNRTEWMQLASQPLGNGRGSVIDADITGDNVGVVSRFEMPSGSGSHDHEATERAIEAIRAGEWRWDVRAGDAWVGNAIAMAFNLDPQADRAVLRGMVTQWVREGVLIQVPRMDRSRHQRQFVEVACRGVFD
jgi:hypothetical protein